MKQFILATLLFSIAIGVFAQNEKYVQSMQKNIAMLDSAKTPADLIAVSAAFERIGDAEKNQWLPYYYASLAHVWRGFRDEKVNKDELAGQAAAVLAKAEALENNAEILIVKNMIATIQMLVDPQSRYMTYGMEASKLLGMAKQLEPNNPRVYYLEGQSTMGTPPQFGGGKDKAKPLFEKSIALYSSYQPSSALHPAWGKSAAEAMLAVCSK